MVAVIGAGPAGLYASKQLAADGCEVALFNKDIKPGGLAEYGIYLTKHKMKEGLRKQFRAILADPLVHYYGNTRVGKDGDLTLADLRSLGFAAVLVTTGAQAAKPLGIAGENLPGVYHAKDVVYHYNLLPPFSRMPMKVGRKVAIVGAGNVMMDIAHWLIDEKQVDEVVAVVRRGPAEVKFDKKELESVAANLDLAALKEEISHATPLMRSLGQDPEAALAFYTEAIHKAEPHTSRTRFSLRFLSAPRECLANDNGSFCGLVVEENTLTPADGGPKPVGTGLLSILNVDTLILAIGDRVDDLLGLPLNGNQYGIHPRPAYPVEGTSYEAYDPVKGNAVDGVFMAGWARQASTGLVGIARKDATNAASAVSQYLAANAGKAQAPVQNIQAELDGRLPYRVDAADILKLEAYEQRQAADHGLEGFKLDTNDQMLAVIQAGKGS
jgi:ferredoxin--NADP+ reductase